MKKCVALILALMLMLSCSVTTYASASEIEGATVSEDLNDTRLSVDPSVVNQILGSSVAACSEETSSGLTVEQIDEELSHLYLDLENANKICELENNEENRERVAEITDRIQMLESDMQQYGFKFLTDAEAAALLGVSNVSAASIYDEPPANWNTQNARVVVSSVLTVTLSTGEEIPYYYVTAYNTTSDSNLVYEPSIPIEKETIGDFIDALIQTYAAKIVGSVISSYSKVLEWLPYEMITYQNIPSAAADYTVEAVYTTTARWIWAYSEYGGRYYQEATVHKTSIANHHVMRYSRR